MSKFQSQFKLKVIARVSTTMTSYLRKLNCILKKNLSVLWIYILPSLLEWYLGLWEEFISLLKKPRLIPVNGNLQNARFRDQ
jgi:hypothetical protein